MKLTQISQSAKQTIQVGRAHHWWWRAAGTRAYPAGPLYDRQWWLIPTEIAQLPAFAQKRVEAIRAAGIPICGVVVAHEAPRLLAAPKRTPPAGAARSALRTLFAVAAALLGMLLYATGLGVVLGVSLLLDPVVYVVLEDGTWIEVVRWYEEC